MDYEWKTDEQGGELSGKLTMPGSGQGIKFPKINPFREWSKKGEKEPDQEEKPQETVQKKILPGSLPDRITITMLGVSGSGKTMFLSGVYQSLIQKSSRGVSLEGDDSRQPADSTLKVTGQIAEIALINRGNAKEGWSFPVGTNRTVEYPLRLRYGGEEICGLDFLDYAGGQLDSLIKVMETSLNADQRKLLNQLKRSDELMIFADADIIAQHDVLSSSAECALCRSEIGVSTVNQLFNDLSSFYRNRSMTVLIVLTKMDKVPREMHRGNYAELVMRTKKVYEDLWESLSQKSRDEENPWNIGIVPVTAVGRNNEVKHVKTAEERDGTMITIEKDVALRTPEPENMDAAMVYSVAAILKQRSQELVKQQVALIDMMTVLGEKEKEAARGQMKELSEAQKKLEEYVNALTMNRGVVPQILERKDNLGW